MFRRRILMNMKLKNNLTVPLPCSKFHSFQTNNLYFSRFSRYSISFYSKVDLFRGGRMNFCPCIKRFNSNKTEENKKKTLWQKIKSALTHYYDGFRLFFVEIKITLGLLNRLTMGKSLTRRESKQIVRTSADLVRMVPFIFFITVPMMEFLIPFYLKLFPRMLPTTFREEDKEKELMKEKLKRKLEIAKYLQDTLLQTSKRKNLSDSEINFKSFAEFLKQVRESGSTADTKDILKFSHLFENEITLDTLNHKQLVGLCKVLELNTLGTSGLLRLQLQIRVKQLQRDDKLIRKEGTEILPVWELQTLCHERGMRALGINEKRLRYQLEQWLTLHLDQNVPITLLLLTRIMYMPGTLTPEEQLKQAIFTLPAAASVEASAKVTDDEESIDSKSRLQAIKEAQREINKERQEARKLTSEVSLKDKAPTIDVITKETPDKAPILKTEDSQIDTAPDILMKTKELKPIAQEVSAFHLDKIESIISDMNKKATIHKINREKIKESGEKISQELKLDSEESEKEKVKKRLSSKLEKTLTDIDGIITDLDSKKTKKINENIKSESEIGDPDKEVEMEESIEESSLKTSLIDVDELLKNLKEVHGENEVNWEVILKEFDTDDDGKVEVEYALNVIKLLKESGVKVTTEEIISVLKILRKNNITEDSE